MKVACPHCGFSREVPEERLPDRPVKVTCPRCEQGFSFDKAAALAASAFDADFGETPGPAAAPPQPETISCPACGLPQPAGEACTGCGVVYAKWTARQEERRQTAGTTAAPQADAAVPGGTAYAAAAAFADQPKAGFWIRFVACLIDTVVLLVVQFAVESALGIVGDSLDELALALVGGLCSMVISMTYYIFFIGYNGQTPGKMALRIQVVRSDGTPMSYGRAFLREIVGKFVSGIILGIGYIMAGFDRNKQALHDKIAGTYVIRL